MAIRKRPSSPPKPGYPRLPRDEMRCVATNAKGERCKAAKLRGRDKCFWHARDPATVHARKLARGEARAALRRLVVKREELPDLEIANAADLHAYQRWIAEAVLTGDLDPRAAETANRAGERMLRAYEATSEGLRLGNINPRTISPGLLAKLKSREAIPFLGTSVQGERDRERFERALAKRVRQFRRRLGKSSVSAPLEEHDDAEEDFVEGDSNQGETDAVDPTENAPHRRNEDLADRALVAPLAREDVLTVMLLDSSDLRSFDQKARAAGLDQPAVAEMLENGFLGHFRRAIVAKHVLPRLSGIVADLVKRAEAGEISATRALGDFLRGSGIDAEHLRASLERHKQVSKLIRRGKAERETDDEATDEDLRVLGLPTPFDDVGSRDDDDDDDGDDGDGDDEE